MKYNNNEEKRAMDILVEDIKNHCTSITFAWHHISHVRPRHFTRAHIFDPQITKGWSSLNFSTISQPLPIIEQTILYH